MSPWLRIVVIWLLALALPAQGLAAASMALCKPVPAAPATASSTEHCHEHAAPVLAEKAEPASAAKAAAASKAKCSVCAACGVAAALPALALQVPEPPLAAAVFSAVLFTVEKFVAAGPERPPRARQA